MSEDSISVQISKDEANGAKNSDNIIENEEKPLSDFQKIAHFWRSSVRVTNTMLEHLQYKYLNELFAEENLTNFDIAAWKQYIDNWKKVHNISYYHLLNILIKQKEKALERETKNKDIKYLNDLIDLLWDVYKKERHILTTLPPPPELDFKETTVTNKNKTDDKYRRIFHNLLHFYVIIYRKQLTSEKLLKRFRILFRNILNRKQKFDEFIRNFVRHQEDSEEVLQRWVELQDLLTNYFKMKPKLTEQTNQFHSFLQVLLNVDELKSKNSIQEFFNDQIYETKNYYFRLRPLQSFKDDAEQLFLILLLDAKFNFKYFIKAHDGIIQKTLNDNFPKQWRRMLHVPMTLLQFQQYQIHLSNLKKNEDLIWNSRITFKDILQEVIDYIINILIKLEICKNTSTTKLDQLNQDTKYLSNLLKMLNEMDEGGRYILFPFPWIPNSNTSVAAHSPIENKSELNDIVFNLYHFYKLINGIGNATKDFLEWNKKMLENVSDNFDNLSYFIEKYIKNPDNEKDISLLLNDFKIFLSKNNNIDNNGRKKEVKEHSRFAELNRLMIDREQQLEIELQSISPIYFTISLKDDKMHEMQIYIILLLNAEVNEEMFISNIINLKSNLIIFSIKIVLQLFLKSIKYLKLKSTISNLEFHINTDQIIHLVDYMQLLVMKYKKEEDFIIYNNVLIQFKDTLQNSEKLQSIEVLQDIENIHKSILYLNDENINKKPNVILCNLYCFWRTFIGEDDLSKKNFCKWNQTMFDLICKQLNEIDLIIIKFVTESEDGSIAKMWKFFKIFLLKKYTEDDEIHSDEINHKSLFESLLNDNISFPNEMEFVLNLFYKCGSYKIYNTAVNEYEILYILILLDGPFSLQEMEHFIRECIV